MGQSESIASTHPQTQNFSENNEFMEEAQQQEQTISVTYGPNILNKVFGHDPNAEILSTTAKNIYQQIKRPKSDNVERVCILSVYVGTMTHL